MPYWTDPFLLKGKKSCHVTLVTWQHFVFIKISIYYLSMSKIVIGIAGTMAAGKGTVAEYLKKKHNAVTFRFSSSLFSILEILGMPVERVNLARISKVLRDEYGEDVLAISLTSQVIKSESPFVIVDGIRRPADVAALSKIPGFKLIYIDAPIELRFSRMKLRGEKADDMSKTFEDFKTDNMLETELLIPGLKKDASYVIDNSGTLDDLYKELDKII